MPFESPATPPKSADATLAGGAQASADNHAVAPETSTVFPGEFSVDEYRPMKVVCVGAGFSGIIAGIRFAQKVSPIDLTIYEKEERVGGTWQVNRYPGLTCDLPSHTYQLSFEEYTQWSSFYATGPEIREYLERVVEKYQLKKYLKLRHELVGAKWDEAQSKWHIRVRKHDAEQGKTEEFEDTADVLFLSTGMLNRWHWPDIQGLNDFKGRVVHSAQWDQSPGGWEETVKGWGDKAVGVIGNGSTGIQLVSALQPRVKKLVNFVRSKTWVSATFSGAKLLELLGRDPESNDFSFTDEYKEKLKDPKFYKWFRHEVEHNLQSFAQMTIKGSAMQKAAADAFRANITKRVERKPELAEKLIPDFSVSCRRLTPGPGYLEALCEDNAKLETTHIRAITETGVELVDDRAVPLDIIICATGYDPSYHYPFDVVGRGGLKLNDRWSVHAEAYLSMAVDGFPNLFWGFGPNSIVNAGSLMAMMEKQVEYAVAATLKLQRERLASMEVKPSAVRAWTAYKNAHFPKTVFSDSCSSWYRQADGNIVGLWPGSSLHAVRALSHPRWEDYEYAKLDKTDNELYWLGDGMTYNEKTLTGDRAWYLNEVDYPPVPSV